MRISDWSSDVCSSDLNALLDTVRELAEKEGASVVPICAKIESENAELDDDEKADFLADLGMNEPGLNRVIRAGYQLLGLQTYFTAGKKEVRAWNVNVGDTEIGRASCRDRGCQTV